MKVGKIKTAIIEEPEISIVEAGFMAISLCLIYDDYAKLYQIRAYEPEYEKYIGSYAGRFLWQIFKITGASKWSEITGKSIRVKVAADGFIEKIGHITEDIWYEREQGGMSDD
jgi:hypothetical protein